MTRHNCRIRVESLEDRALLACDAMAALAGANLMIHGSNQADEIVVAEGEAEGEFEVTGIGDDSDPTVFSDIEGNIIVNLGGGDDSFVMTGGEISGDLVVMGGGGENSITLGAAAADDSADPSAEVDLGVTVGGNLVVRTGGSDDQVSLVDIEADGTARVSTHGGDDTVDLSGLVAAGLQLNTGNGDDSVTMDGFQEAEAGADVSTSDDGAQMVVDDSLPAGEIGEEVTTTTSSDDNDAPADAATATVDASGDAEVGVTDAAMLDASLSGSLSADGSLSVDLSPISAQADAGAQLDVSAADSANLAALNAGVGLDASATGDLPSAPLAAVDQVFTGLGRSQDLMTIIPDELNLTPLAARAT